MIWLRIDTKMKILMIIGWIMLLVLSYKGAKIVLKKTGRL